MPASGMARRGGGLVLGTAAAAAAWLGSGTSVALADGKKKEDGSAAPYFDPDALERGAKALREINSSPHAKQASGDPGPPMPAASVHSHHPCQVTQTLSWCMCWFHAVSHTGH